MRVQVIYGDEGSPLGLNLVGQGDGENQVLQRFQKEGMMPLSFNPKEGLVVTFGHPVGTDTGGEGEDDDIPTEASRWAG